MYISARIELAGKSSLDYGTISSCATGTQGKTLLAAASAKYVAAIASEGSFGGMVPDFQINNKHQVPEYSYQKEKAAICAAGATGAACTGVAKPEEMLCAVP